MRDIFIRVLNSAKENSPALLTGVAVAGVIGTFLLTDHAAVRANHILADAYDHDEIPKDLPPAEKAKIHLKLTWKEYMQIDLRALRLCDSIYMMKGWRNSRGARIEHWFAKRIGLKVYYQN